VNSKWFWVSWFVSLALASAIWGAVVFVAFHFISKWW
jgi:hypothetical protein